MNFEQFIKSFENMGIGMASIIIVIGVLILSVMLLNLFTSDKVKKSRKIIFVSALIVLVISLSLLNNIRIENTVTEYYNNNKEKVETLLCEPFNKKEYQPEVTLEKTSFIVTVKCEDAEDIKEEIKSFCNEYKDVFEENLAEIKKDVKVIKNVKLNFINEKSEEIFSKVIG